MFATLEAARDAMGAIAGVASCKIGLEQGITASDYPLVRLVPSRLAPGRPYSQRTADCLIYFGMDITSAEAGGLEAVYSAMFDLEAGILAVLKSLGHRYIETITDEDRLDTYKLATIRCEIIGAQPAP